MSIGQSIRVRATYVLGGLVLAGFLMTRAEAADGDLIATVLVANDLKHPVPVVDVDRTPVAFHDGFELTGVTDHGKSADFAFADGTTRVIEHVSVEVALSADRRLLDHPYASAQVTISDPLTGRAATHVLPLESQIVTRGVRNSVRVEDRASFVFSSPMRLVLNPGNRVTFHVACGDDNDNDGWAEIGISGVTVR